MQRSVRFLFAVLALGSLPATALLAAAPGLRLGVLASSDAPLSTVDGELFGEALAFVADSAERTRWSAWAAIALDRAPGTYELNVRASAADRPVWPARVTVTVIAKSFPEQRLTVEEKYVSPSKEAEERIARERKRLDALYAKRTSAPASREEFSRPVPG